MRFVYKYWFAKNMVFYTEVLTYLACIRFGRSQGNILNFILAAYF